MAFDKVLERADEWQRGHRFISILYGVSKKFGDDQANQYVVSLGWYGFMAIYPLLLVVITVLGFIGAASLGHQVVATLHQFPVVGAEFNPAHPSTNLHASSVGLAIGLIGLLYGAQGVTQTAQQAMVRVWNIPPLEAPGFLKRLTRSLTGLGIIGGAFVINAALATLATGGALNAVEGPPVLVGMALVNVAFYAAAFRALTPTVIQFRTLLPGAAVAAIGFTFLITIGSGLVQHQLRNSSATYGQFGIVIGLVAFLLLLAKISLYGAELNPVLARKLWPRSLQNDSATEADDQVLRDITHQNLRRRDQWIGVGFGEHGLQQVADDAQASKDRDLPHSSESDQTSASTAVTRADSLH